MVLDNKIYKNINFLRRLFSIFFLLPIYFYSIISQSFLANFIILITAVFLSIEWFLITQKENNFIKISLFLIAVVLNIFISTFTNFFFSFISTFFFLFLFSLFIFFKNTFFKNLPWIIYGLFYLSVPLIVFFQIKNLDNGIVMLCWLMIIITTTDIFSYLFGNIFKGPKIFPKTSPSKTYSGTILGLLTGTLFGILYSLNYLNNDNIFILILFSFFFSISGLLGDIFLSNIKRKFNVKDSSNLLPGHGGFLDRFDSISFGLINLFFIHFFI